VRIVAGTHRGRRLRAPGGTATRPTADRVREAVFSIIGPVDGFDVLDLFAGSGALGLEALSRGASSVLFVENSQGVLPVLKENLAAVGLPGGRVISGSVPTVVGGAAPARFDLVLADPPYATPSEEVQEVLRSLAERAWLAPGAVVVVERSSRDPLFEWPTPLVGLRDRRYGEALLRYGRSS
jgi:16S rRNA (guanine966-N2)-methyltransferase